MACGRLQTRIIWNKIGHIGTLVNIKLRKTFSISKLIKLTDYLQVTILSNGLFVDQET